MLSYRVTLDVPLQLVVFVSRLAGRSPARARHPGRDACPDLLEASGLRADLVPGPPGNPPAGQGSGISQATAYHRRRAGVVAGV